MCGVWTCMCLLCNPQPLACVQPWPGSTHQPAKLRIHIGELVSKLTKMGFEVTDGGVPAGPKQKEMVDWPCYCLK